MGTTRDAIRGSNPELAFVLCIQGYPYLLTDASTSAVETAWSSSLWSSALGGLRVTGDLSQSIEPWSNEPSVQSLTFSIIGDNDNDQFASDVFTTKPTNRSELTVGFDTSDSDGGGFNITVREADQFASATHVHVGNEAFLVSGTPAGTTIAVATNGEGYLNPFSGNTGSTNRFPAPHSIAGDFDNVENYDTNAPVYVTDTPTKWVGKKVGLWVHRVTDGVLDTKAQAELWFAGRIAEVSEGEMSVDLQCDGIVQSIMEAEVLADQWTGTLKEGYVFDGTEKFHARYFDESVSPFVGYRSLEFTTTGRLTADELASELADFLDQDSLVGAGTVSPNLRWEAGTVDTSNGPRFVLTASRDGSTTDKEAFIELECSSADVLKFLGWNSLGTAGSGYYKVKGPRDDNYTWTVTSEDAPYRYPTLGGLDVSSGVVHSMTQLEIEESNGTFYDYTAYLPSQAQQWVDGDVWSLYSLGNSVLFLGRRVSATSITGLTFGLGLPNIGLRIDDSMSGLRIGDGNTLRVKQCLMITGGFKDLVAKFFASIDGNGINHATYDAFGFGGASVEWDLLGSSFLSSLQEVEETVAENTLTIIAEKPMRLWDILKSDFAMRMAAPVWKDGGIQIAQLRVPNASTAEHTLDETNKGDARRTVPKQTSAWLTHTLKIKYNRDVLKDRYRDEYIVRDKLAYQESGRAGKTKTLKARNSYAGVVQSGASVEAVGDMLAHKFMPVLGRPLKTWERSINHQLFHMAPGDTVSLTDDRIRANDGARGVASVACTVLSVSHSLGISSGGGQGYHGNVVLLYTEEDRCFQLAPSAEHADATTTATGRNWTNGYDDEVGTAGEFSLLVLSNEFSHSSEAADVSHFAVGDAIRITELDPADSASADTFTDTIADINEGVAIAGTLDEIVLTTGFGNSGNPAFDGTKTYIVTFDSYDQCDAAQKLHAFQADDADGEILDTIDANILGDDIRGLELSAAVATELPARYAAEEYGDGVPLSTSFVRDRVRMANNLTEYKTAPHMPVVGSDGHFAPGGDPDEFNLAYCFPFFVGPTIPGEKTRKLNVAPAFSSTSGTNATIRITSSNFPPRNYFNANGREEADFGLSLYKQVTFSTTSTTDYSIPSASELDVIRAVSDPMITWLTVEVDEHADYFGIAELWLGPTQ